MGLNTGLQMNLNLKSQTRVSENLVNMSYQLFYSSEATDGNQELVLADNQFPVAQFLGIVC